MRRRAMELHHGRAQVPAFFESVCVPEPMREPVREPVRGPMPERMFPPATQPNDSRAETQAAKNTRRMT
jgi:hypothetical protein